jgi:multidrug efflux pump subunit AcrA (membrane-fusion protein)
MTNGTTARGGTTPGRAPCGAAGRRAAAVFAAALLAAGPLGCSKKDAAAPAAGGKAAQAAVPVDVRLARVGSAQRTVEVVGTLFGEEDATISNKVNGKVIALYKDVGDRADPGEPLAQLLKNDYLLSLNQKRSSLLESLAKLGLDEVPGDEFDIAALPAVRRAKLQAENAEAKFGRGKQLFEQKPPLVSQQDFEDLQTSRSVAKSDYDVAVAAARGLVSEARTKLADLRVAEQALADTTVRAPQDKYAAPDIGPGTKPAPAAPVAVAAAAAKPAATQATASLAEGVAAAGPGAAAVDPLPALPPGGADPAVRPPTRPAAGQHGRYVVAARLASLGELFPAVSPMFRLVKDDPLKLRAAVPARYFPELAIGQTVKVRIDAYPLAEFDGEVTRINPQVDQANRTFPIEVTIPNADRKLPPGDFARGSVKTKVEPGVVFVPAQAVVSFAGNDKVFVVGKDGKAKEVPVKLGDRVKGADGQDEVEVVREPAAASAGGGGGGLKGDEQIVVTGTSRLANGMAVQVKPGGDAAATKPAK